MKIKLKVSLLFCVVFIASIFMSMAAFAEANIAEVRVTINIDGYRKIFDYGPIIVNNRTLLPLRGLLTELGVPNDDQHIMWNAGEKSVTVIKGNKKIYLKVGSTQTLVDNVPTTIDVAPVNYKDRVYIPVRFISQSLNMKTVWYEYTKTVFIKSPDEDKKLPKIYFVASLKSDADVNLFFDFNSPEDISVILELKGTLKSVELANHNESLISGTDYEVNGNVLTIKSSYLKKLTSKYDSIFLRSNTDPPGGFSICIINPPKAAR